MPSQGRAVRDRRPDRPLGTTRSAAGVFLSFQPDYPLLDRVEHPSQCLSTWFYARLEDGKMKLSIIKSGNACGAELKLDLSSEIDGRTFAEIEQAFHDNIVIHFRGQQLSNE